MAWARWYEMLCEGWWTLARSARFIARSERLLARSARFPLRDARDQVGRPGGPPGRPAGRCGAGQQSTRQTSGRTSSVPSAARVGEPPRSASIRSRTRSTHIATKESTGSVPGATARANKIPASAAVAAASASRSHITSMWSLTNPTGTITTDSTPVSASRRISSFTSGSSHGIWGGTRSALPHEGVRRGRISDPLGDEAGCFGELRLVVGGRRHRHRNRVGGEHQRRSCVLPEFVDGGAGRFGERLDEARVVVVGPNLVDVRDGQVGSTLRNLVAGSDDVLAVLATARVGRVRGREDGERESHRPRPSVQSRR